MAAPWLKHPPTASLWSVEDVLTQLARAGVHIDGPVPGETFALLDRGQWVFDNSDLWRRRSAAIDAHRWEALRLRLGSALDACRGFN